MAKFIQVPTSRTSTSKWRINIDHIVWYDGNWIYLNGQAGKVGQTVSSNELDELIAVAESGVVDLIPKLS